MKQNKSLQLLFTLLLIPFFLLAQSNRKQYFDGPYVFEKKDSLQVQWIEAGVPFDTTILKKDAGVFQRNGLPIVDLQDLEIEIDKKTSYEDVGKLIALSDVHGQYDVLIKLLQANHVIDEKNKWIYDKGHLVIVGDNFDRGDKVTEILWFLFFLQKEAIKAGGNVHVLLGNHEVMVLQGDLRYLNRKYLFTAGAFTSMYQNFYRKGSILGDWITNHKVVMSINKRIFVHGGISPAVLNLGLSLNKINSIIRKRMVRREKDVIVQDEDHALLYQGEGPLWYRGYFGMDRLDMEAVDVILKRFNQKGIVVGHTSMKEITSYYDEKVIAIDCSIKIGETGQVLIMENGKCKIGGIDGKTKEVVKEAPPKKGSLFEHIYQLEGKPKLTITTDAKQLIRKSSKEEYQPTTFQLFDKNGKSLLELDAKIRSRGNMRKKVCAIPPVKVNFKDGELDSLGFDKEVDKLKFVFPCKSASSQQKYLFKEFFLYQLYDLMDDKGMRVKLVDVKIMDGEKDKYNWTGFMIEDEDEYARRMNAKVIESGRLSASRLEREPFLRMVFFQYMIANVDWSIKNKHNIELVKLESLDKILAVPYDFDYSGFVGQDYAVPAPNLPIQSVHERYFFSQNRMTKEEFDRTVEFFLSIEKDVFDLVDNATYMDNRCRKDSKNYLNDFYKMLKKKGQLQKEFVKK